MSASSSQSVSKVGRNDPCECNSGKKAKACCGEKKAQKSVVSKTITAVNNELLNPSQSTVEEYIRNRREEATKLAKELFGGSEAQITISIRQSRVSIKMFETFVLLNRPRRRPVVAFTADTNRNSAGDSLEALTVALQKVVAAKEEEAWRLAREASDKATGIEASKGSAGGDSRS